MRLLKIFNESYLHFLQILHKSFPDNTMIFEELKRIQDMYKERQDTIEIHNRLKNVMDSKFISLIMDKDESIIPENFQDTDVENTFFHMLNIDTSWYHNLEPSEKEVFWGNLQDLSRYSSMVRACGDNVSELEALATDFMARNDTQDQSKYHELLFQELLQGGALSKKVLESFSSPECMKSVLENVGNILKYSNKTNENSNNENIFENLNTLFNKIE